MRLLYIQASFVAPPKDCLTDRFFLLSKDLEGDILQPVWFTCPEEVEQAFGPGSYPVYIRGNFRYHWSLAWRYHGLRRKLALVWFYLSKGLQLHREKPFDCVMAYSHMTTGLCGVVLKILTGAKLIVELATSPDLVYLTERANPGLRERSLRAYSDFCLHCSLLASNRAHLLYPAQLAAYPLLRNVRASVFHEFVAVSTVPRHCGGGERYILLVGAPWYLKGADLLIEAFRRLAADFPDVKLKLLGHYPDWESLDALSRGAARIELLKARPNPEALAIIARASIFCLPSRCEGMGRVILEAMAAGVPVVASNVGGIPHLMRHGGGGRLVPTGDVSALESELRALLSDSALMTRIGLRGYEAAHAAFNEQIYTEQFTRMVDATVRNDT